MIHQAIAFAQKHQMWVNQLKKESPVWPEILIKETPSIWMSTIATFSYNGIVFKRQIVDCDTTYQDKEQAIKELTSRINQAALETQKYAVPCHLDEVSHVENKKHQDSDKMETPW